MLDTSDFVIYGALFREYGIIPRGNHVYYRPAINYLNLNQQQLVQSDWTKSELMRDTKGGQ